MDPEAVVAVGRAVVGGVLVVVVVPIPELGTEEEQGRRISSDNTV